MKPLLSNRGLSLTEILFGAMAVAGISYFAHTVKQNLTNAKLRTQANRTVNRLERSFMEGVTDGFFERSAGGIQLDSTNPYYMRYETQILSGGAISVGSVTFSVTCDSTAGTALQGLPLSTVTPTICTGLTGPTTVACSGADKRLMITMNRVGMEGPASNTTRIYPLNDAHAVTQETRFTTPVAAVFCADVPAAQVAGPPNPYVVTNGSDVRFHLATAFLKRTNENKVEVVWKQEMRYLPVRPRNVNGVSLLGGN